MGSSSSKQERDDKAKAFFGNMRSKVDDEIARRMMIQREIQMAVQIAKARDSLWYFGSLWMTLVGGVSGLKLARKPVPSVVGIPIVVGGVMLGNLADMAYGNKLLRVTKEAEHLMDYERGRFVPMQQAAFHKFYSSQEREQYYDSASAVGELFPTKFIFGRSNN